MKDLPSIESLKNAKEELHTLKSENPELFEEFLHIIRLTRAFGFKYHYMGCSFMNEDPGVYIPKGVYSFVLDVYEKEMQHLKNRNDAEVLKKILSKYKEIGYAKFSQLMLGEKPESVVGPTSLK